MSEKQAQFQIWEQQKQIDLKVHQSLMTLQQLVLSIRTIKTVLEQKKDEPNRVLFVERDFMEMEGLLFGRLLPLLDGLELQLEIVAKGYHAVQEDLKRIELLVHEATGI